MKIRTMLIITYGVAALLFYLAFDWTATSLHNLELINPDLTVNLAKRSLYALFGILSFIAFMYFYIKFLWIFFKSVMKNYYRKKRTKGA
ncbi:hypothetical protein [Sulfurospirillum multivorans]|nr:hypothetical protein [Sulfurospirillum multivorans]QEH06590.1 putative membrane protein [Sulfurospirillum multivorans]